MARTKSDAKRSAALQALLETDTLTDAAQRAGISRTTLWEYLQDHEFARILRSIREQRAIDAEADAMAAKRAALAELTKIMTDDKAPHAARIGAARTILADATDTIRGVDATISGIITRSVIDIF